MLTNDKLRYLPFLTLYKKGMKKGLLFATALCMATSAMAQTTIETALDAQTGKNSYQVDGTESQSIYWKYTADKNYLAKVSPMEGKYDTPNVLIYDADGNEVTLTGCNAGYPKKAYALKKGETYYFTMKSVGEIGFNLELDEASSYGMGLTEDTPLEIKLGEEHYMGNPISTSQYESTTFYATYKAEEDGLLKLNLSGYINSATVNGESLQMQYTQTGAYYVQFATEKGKSYNIKLSLGGGVTGKAEIAQIVPGSLDTPFTLAEGENSVPAAQGDYYFTYKATQAGYLNIQSDAVLPGGQVKVYTDKSNITYGNVAASSEAGSYNVRVEINNPGTTYYIVVNKLQATDSEDKLNVTMNAFKAGETINNPIVISELPSEQTLPEAKGTYYYSVNIPANTNKFVVIKANKTELNESTSAIFYNRYNGEYGAATMQNGEIKQYFNATYDQTYIIKVTSNEEEPLKFRVAYEEAAKGSLASMPIEAIAGDNEITIDGTEYFTYTATKTGKLTVEGEPGVKISFPRGTDSWSGYYDAVQRGVEYSISAQAGTTYLIQVDNAQKGTTIYLDETDFKAGEARENPIIMEGDEYTFTSAGAADLWLQYNVTQDGILDFACSAIYSSDTNGMIQLSKNDSPETFTMMDTEVNGTNYTTVYKGKIRVAKGDKLYIHCKLPGTVTGDKITFSPHEAQPGETVDNPLTLEKGGSLELSGMTYEAPVWVKIDLPAGQNELLFNGYITGDAYTNESDAQAGTNSIGLYSSQAYTDDGTYTPISDENGEPIYKYTFTMPEAGTAYLAFKRADNRVVKFYYKDPTATGIYSVEVFNDGKAEIFKADGTKVSEISGSGLYIIKSNGKTKKVMINK